MTRKRARGIATSILAATFGWLVTAPGCSGIPCGDAGTCAGGTYCRWHFNSCGKAGFDYQECSTTPPSCSGASEPVCACDGEVYDDFCDAVSQGVPVGESAKCAAPAGFFACGSKFCRAGEQHCRVQQAGDFLRLECIDLPSGCSACACLTPPGGGDGCTCSTSGGNVRVDCEPEL